MINGKFTAFDYHSVYLRKITNRIVFCAGSVFAVVLFFFGRFYCSVFVDDAEIINMVSRGFKIFVLEFLLQGFNVAGSMYFTSINCPKQSAVIAFDRNGDFLCEV